MIYGVADSVFVKWGGASRREVEAAMRELRQAVAPTGLELEAEGVLGALHTVLSRAEFVAKKKRFLDEAAKKRAERVLRTRLDVTDSVYDLDEDGLQTLQACAQQLLSSALPQAQSDVADGPPLPV